MKEDNVYDPFEILMLSLDDLFVEFGAQDYKGDYEVFGTEVINPITRGYTWGSFKPEIQEKVAVAYEAYLELVEMAECEEDSEDEESSDDEEE